MRKCDLVLTSVRPSVRPSLPHATKAFLDGHMPSLSDEAMRARLLGAFAQLSAADHGQSAALGSAPALVRPLCLLSARLAALGGPVLPE